MIISKPELFFKSGCLHYQVPIYYSGKTEILWFSLKEKYADLVSYRSDAPLVALLIPAMAQGEDIRIEGTVSEKLFYNLSGPYQTILKLIIPSLHLVKIIPSEVRPAYCSGEGVAMGFSGGIDSFSVFADHHYSEVTKGFQVTHLLFNNVGSHGPDGEKSRRLFHRRYNRLKPLTDKLGLPFIAIDSNVDSFYHGFTFEQTVIPRNVSVTLLLQRGLKRYLYASDYHYKNTMAGPIDNMSTINPVALPLLSIETLDLVSSGSQYTRVEKTIRVAEIEDSYQFLDVCTNEDPQIINCSTCYKCMRTMLTLEVAGKLECYSNVFDLDTYRKNRDFYIEEVLQSNDSYLLKEITDFINEIGFDVPLSSRLFLRTKQAYFVSTLKNATNIPMGVVSKIKQELMNNR